MERHGLLRHLAWRKAQLLSHLSNALAKSFQPLGNEITQSVVTPGHAIQACRENVRPRGVAFSSSSSLSQQELFFCLFNVLLMHPSVAGKLPQEHANGR